MSYFSDLLQLDTPPRSNSGVKSQRKAVHFTPVANQRPLAQQDLLTATPDSSLVLPNDDEVRDYISLVTITLSNVQCNYILDQYQGQTMHPYHAP